MIRSVIYSLSKCQERSLCVKRLAHARPVSAVSASPKVGSGDESQTGREIPIWLENNLKLKVEEKSATETYVECVKVEEDVKIEHQKPCILCRLNITNLHYTDVKVLAQFIKKSGAVVTYHESGLCSKQYKRVLRMIKDAQRCNLIPRPPDYLVPGAWHDLNTYIERDRVRDQPVRQFVKKEYWKI